MTMRFPSMPEHIARLPRNEAGGSKERHPLYQVWRGMLRRCYNERAHGFHNYGGRGIEVWAQWRENFWAFVADMPERPSPKHTLDRISVDDGYVPGNVRWATRYEQSRNMRPNHRMTLGGETKIMKDWANELGLPLSTIHNRLSRGWDEAAALSIAPQSKAPDHSVFPPGGRALCIERGLNPYSVASRIRRGWDFERAIATPMGRQKGRGRAKAQ